MQLRFFLIIILAVSIVIIDNQYKISMKLRVYMDIAINPIYLLISKSRQLLDSFIHFLTLYSQLKFENLVLHQELLLKNNEQFLLNQYKLENIKLHKLLKSPICFQQKKILTQVIFNSNELYKDQVIIDKGNNDGVYTGQIVIDEKGVVGQVISTNQFNSRILLICNFYHEIPVQVIRNDIKINNIKPIVIGNGCFEHLRLENISDKLDIRVGDLLITSGFGGRFPEGYPVAIVSFVKIDIKNDNLIIKAYPTANLKNLHYLLLLGQKNK